jgi:two-component system chemotaxis sensor kinase CheA
VNPMVKDRYKYFRIEARELLEGLNQGVLELEKDSQSKELVARILRLAHTLKGAARVVKQPGIADLAHEIEDVFAAYREGGLAVPKDCINRALGLLDAISKRVASLDVLKLEARREGFHPVTEESETVRVEIDEVDKLLHGASEATVQITALRRETGALAHARQLAAGLVEDLAVRPGIEANGTGLMARNPKIRTTAEELRSHLDRLERSFRSGIDQLEAEFAQVRDAANRLRLLPAAAIFAPLERAVRDAAQSLHKEVMFECHGGDNRLDTHVLAGLRDALLHVVRNAVAHGIESQAERIKAGKPAQGRVELRIERRGNRAAFICRDDGQGIDLEAVRQVAVRRGLVASSEAASLGLEAAVRIILKGGVTTSQAVDEVSGRGIGLDVVRETAARLKGEISVVSEPGKGASVEICVPVSLSSLAALEVDAGGTIASLPLDAVRQIVRVAAHEVTRSGETESIVYEGKVIPFLALTRALGKKRTNDRRKQAWSAIVLEASSGTAAVGVDRLVAANTVVVRPLPALAKAEPFVAGASLDSEGNPQLVLDPEGLVARASVESVSALGETPERRTPVLVIDDSLTTRMLEQSILESAGYEVDLAISGEEALRKASERAYSLFLVDVEMPGIDGFEFVTRTQADANLRSVPSILVTSRSAAEDRRRGEQVGARGYVVKGEFDQGQLLRMIEGLLRIEDGEDTRTGS